MYRNWNTISSFIQKIYAVIRRYLLTKNNNVCIERKSLVFRRSLTCYRKLERLCCTAKYNRGCWMVLTNRIKNMTRFRESLSPLQCITNFFVKLRDSFYLFYVTNLKINLYNGWKLLENCLEKIKKGSSCNLFSLKTVILYTTTGSFFFEIL